MRSSSHVLMSLMLLGGCGGCAGDAAGPVDTTGGPPGGQPVGQVGFACPETKAPDAPAPTRSLYVDAASGSDAADGLTPATAWRTLGQANQEARPGDVIYLRGTFGGQYVNPARSGTATAKIAYVKWPGATAILEGGRDGSSIFLPGRSHIVIDGLEVRNVQYSIQVVDGSSHVWLRNLWVHDIGTILIERSSDNRFEDSRIERCGNEASNAGDCLWIAYNAHRNVVARNVMRYAGHALLSIGGDKAGQGTADDNVVTGNDISNGWANNMSLIGFARRTVVECNRIHHATTESTINYSRAGMNINAGQNVVRYNLLHDNEADGIQVQGYDFQGVPMNPVGNRIYQNTIVRNGGAGIAISQQRGGVVSDNVFEQNILWGNNTAGQTERGRWYEGGSYEIWMDLYNANAGWPAGALNGNVFRNNIVGTSVAEIGRPWMYYVSPNGTASRSYTLATAQSSLPSAVMGNREVDPLLGPAPMFDLQAGSPALDAGAVLFDGQRFQGGAPDLGARERTP